MNFSSKPGKERTPGPILAYWRDAINAPHIVLCDGKPVPNVVIADEELGVVYYWDEIANHPEDVVIEITTEPGPPLTVCLTRVSGRVEILPMALFGRAKK